MSLKKELAREIKLIEEEIKELEVKRSRSEASIIEALISKTKPTDDDAVFFRTFTAEIEVKRERLQKLTRELEKVK